MWTGQLDGVRRDDVTDLRRRATTGATRRRRPGRSILAAALLAVPLAVASAAVAAPERPMERVIVRFHPLGPTADVGVLSERLVGPSGGRLTALYQYAVQGFAAELPAPAVAALARNPLVAAITPDRIVSIDATDPEVPTGIDRIEGDRNVSAGPVDVDIAIIDSGIVAHPDLNVVSTVDCTPWWGLLGCWSGNQGSVHWHATHVAGIAAARDDGVGVEGAAPGARLWSVRVLDSTGSGSLSQIIQGIDWVTSRAGSIEVANMSLGGAFQDSTFNTAISNSVAAGIVYVVAAGNDGADASGFSPASHPSVLTTSAIADSDGQPGAVGGPPSCRADQDDTFADFSNYGLPVDVAAPGVCILSTYPGGGYAVASGTSMASPHAAGVVARYLAAQGMNPSSASEVAVARNAVIAASIPQSDPCGFTGDRDTYAEPLVFLNATELGGDGSCGASGPADGPPAADWTSPSAGAVVSGVIEVSGEVTDAEDDPGDLVVDYRVGDGSWTPMSHGVGDTFSATWDTTETGDGPATLDLRATDTAGNTTVTSRSVTVDNAENVPPTAAFTVDCTGLTCTFDAGGSDDPDGVIVDLTWDFGDGSTGSGWTPSHTYATGGTRTVELSVTDDEGAAGTASRTVTVTAPTTMSLGTVWAELVGRRNNILQATVEVRSDGAAVSGANVTGYFVVNGGEVRSTGTTATNGVATLSGGRVKWSDFVSYFCVDGVSKPGLTLTSELPHCVLVYP